MASPEAQFESSNSTSSSDLGTYCSLRGHSMSRNCMEEETHRVPEAKDVGVQMRLCCSDLQSLEILDTTRCDTPLCGQSTMLLAPDTGNKSSIFKGSGVLITRTRYHLGDDGNSKAKDSPKGFMERIASLHRRSRSDDLTSSNFSRPSPSVGMHEEPSSTPRSECDGLDKVDIWVPSLDLDKEDSQWDDKDGSDSLGPDFPSPSYRMLQNLRVRTSKLSLCPSFRRLLDNVQLPALGSPSSSLLELSLKRAAGVDSPQQTPHADEPLFWPFDGKSYWRPEFDGNYLGISPRAGIFRIKRPRGRHAPKSLEFGQQQHDGNNRSPPSSLHRKNMHQGYRGSRFLTSTTSRSEKPTPATKKATALHNQAPHASRVPSRLSRSSTGSSAEKSASINSPKKKGKNLRQLGSGKNKKRRRDQSSTMIQYLLEFEAGVYLGGEIPIEALVGLDEFDGHEGVGKVMAS